MILNRDPDAAVVRALRNQRRRRRVADLEWFEVLYRVYLVAIGGGSIALWASTFATDSHLDPAEVADVVARGPAILGLAAALAVGIGMRSGSHGGPLAIEDADVQHVLLSPVSRTSALRAPCWQRLRSAAFSGTVGGALLGQLAGRRMPGSIYGWALSGAAVGFTIGLLYVAVAFLAHILAPRDWQVTAVAAVFLGAQGLAAADVTSVGPFDTIGSLALWPERVHWIDLGAIVVAIGLGVLAWLRVGGLSVEQLARRSNLVSQLRFAATMQDLRTVVLLRRQLSLELPRARPWFRAPHIGGIVIHRGLQSVARFPVRRVVRLGSLSVVAAVLGVVAYRGWTPAALLVGMVWLLVGMEAIEPLSQELDHPERTELLPVDPGALHHRLLAPCAAVLIVLGLIAGLIGGAIEGARGSSWSVALTAGILIGVPAALFGGLAAALNAVGGAPDPLSPTRNGAMMPPEVAGITTMFAVAFPPAVAILGSIPIILVRESAESGGHPLAAALRSAIFLVVLLTIGAWWIRARTQFKAWWRKTTEEAANQRRPAEGTR